MQNDNSIMHYESVLPSDFDGVFRFSNPSGEDFVGRWAGKEYLFPAGAMTPIVIVDHSPLEVQHIRKKFARDLAEREFYKSKGYRTLQGQEGKPGNRNFNSIHQAAAYTLNDLEPYIQQCLKPLPEGKLVAKATVTVPLEETLNRDDKGNLVTEAIDGKTSLRQKALESN